MGYGALGGGVFLTQNKTLPGAYINYASVERASGEFSERGYATIALPLDWGATGEVITIEAADLQMRSLELLGHEYTSEKLKPIREIMLGAKVLYLYRINDTGGAKATANVGDNLVATAKHAGVAGNEITITVENDPDKSGAFIVTTIMRGKVIDKQSVASIVELKENSVVSFSTSSENALTVVAGVKLESGTNGTANGSSHSNYLELIERYNFNVIGYSGDDASIKALYKAFMVRLREEEGVKFQCVVLSMDKEKANHEALINVKNKAEGDDVGAVVYWALGQLAGCPVNRSLTNKKYNGEYQINTKYKSRDAKQALKEGFFFLYEKDNEVRVLDDINSFTEFTAQKNEDFSKNQIVRVLDQRAIDVAIIFNKRHLGKVQNDADGRISFWNELVKHAQTLEKVRAIENYDSKDTAVEKGDMKDSVIVHDYIAPVQAMGKLYQTIWVR